MTLYEIIIDNVTENVTIRQTPKHYSNSRFGGGTGPNLKELEAQKKARKETISFQIIANNDDTVNINISQQQSQKHSEDIDSSNC